MKERLLVALGGNALIKKGQKGTAQQQLENLKVPIKQIANLLDRYSIVITHGNGPQVGNLLLQQESCDKVAKMPLDILVAQTQGQIGFMIELTLDNELMRRGYDKKYRFITVLTYVEVDKNDPAFEKPTKPVGPVYTREEIKNIPYTVKLTQKGYRRVVPSPFPKRIIEKNEIKMLLENNFIVIACGGGGIPVIKESCGFRGIEAVIDKDLASAQLALEVGIDHFIIATDVNKVYLDYNKKTQKALDIITVKEAEKYMELGQFGQGSMKPKIEAACHFIKNGGKKAVITSIENIEKALDGKAGTKIIL